MLSFSTLQANKLSGVPVDTLKYWASTKVAIPSVDKGAGQGKARRWSFTDLLGLRVVASLRDQGVSLQRVRKILPKLKALTRKDSNLAALAGSRLAVLPDGDVAIRRSSEELISLLNSPSQQLMAPIMIMDLDAALRDVESRMLKAAKSDVSVLGSIAVLKQQGAWILEAA